MIYSKMGIQYPVHGNTGMDRNGPEWTPERIQMDSEVDRNGHRNGPEWTVEWTGMDREMDRNGPEDTMKSLALHPFSIHVMFS